MPHKRPTIIGIATMFLVLFPAQAPHLPGDPMSCESILLTALTPQGQDCGQGMGDDTSAG